MPLVGLYELMGHDKLCEKYDLKIVSPESKQGALDVLQSDNPHATPSPSKSNRDAFIAAAKAAGVDEDEKRWEARLKAVAKAPTKPSKKSK